MNEEPTREEVVKFLTHWKFLTRWIMNGWSWSNKDVRLLNKAIEYIQQAPKYRKKAKRWKRKYMSLRSEVEKMRAEIAEDLANVMKEAKQTQDDIAFGKGTGLHFALDAVNKYTAKGSGEE